MLSFRWLCLGLLLLTGCQKVDALPPTATTLRVVQATLPPDSGRDLHAVASQTATAAPTPDECDTSAALPTTRHAVSATISYAEHRAVVEQHIRTINRSSDLLRQVVFDVEPNRFAAIFTLDAVSSDHGMLGYELTGRRLTLDLSEPLAPGCRLEVDLDFTLHAPLIGQGISGSGGYLGYTEHQLNLGQWLPMLALYRNGQWITHDVSGVGEQVVVEVADWDVTLTVNDAPSGLLIAAPGTLVEHDPKSNRWHYTVANAREFTLSMSPQYGMLAEKTDEGVSVELYTFADQTTKTAGGTVDNARQALDAAVQALSMYADLFGVFPYERFVVVEGDFPDGMEFSGIVFVSDQWFRGNNGTPGSYLTIITVHETSHQWWYARVGSDQALTPWMDEALAVYSEYIFYEEHYPDLKQWWWNFRVDSYVGKDYSGRRVDSTVYEFASVREYINAVYLRGAHMLDDLRHDLGTDAFFDWLRRYAQAGQYRVVTPDLFWSLLTPEQYAQTRATRAKYLSGDQK